MTDKPYTDADVELVAATFTAEAKKNPIDTSAPPWMPQTRLLLGPTEHDIARAVLDALADAGRLATSRTCEVTIERPDDETIEVHVNGQEVATANHDEHGWSGMDAVERTALAVARACGARSFCDCEEYDCAGECCGVGNCSCTPAPGQAHPRGEGPSIVTVDLPGISR